MPATTPTQPLQWSNLAPAPLPRQSVGSTSGPAPTTSDGFPLVCLQGSGSSRLRRLLQLEKQILFISLVGLSMGFANFFLFVVLLARVARGL